MKEVVLGSLNPPNHEKYLMPMDQIMNGVGSLYGKPKADSIFIPGISADGTIEAELFAKMKNYVVLYPKKCEDSIEERINSAVNPEGELLNIKLDYARGGNISVEALKYGIPILRKETKLLLEDIKARLEIKPKKWFQTAKHSNIFTLQHVPGAGGSTAGHQILWELHNDYPCVAIVNSTLDSTTEGFLLNIWEKSNKALVVLVDCFTIQETQVFSLANTLNSATITAVIIHVQRINRTGIKSSPYFLDSNISDSGMVK